MSKTSDQQLVIDKFNEKNKIDGVSIIHYKNDKGENVEGVLRWPAELIRDGVPVVWMVGVLHAIPFENVIQ